MMSVLEGITLAQHYQLQRRLARGGMSEIYLAIDTRTNQKVAVKLVQQDNTEFCERFRREMYAVSTLEHDHILPSFDYGEYDPWCYMVMPYIEQGTLRERIAHGPLSPTEAASILDQLASALQHAHDHGIVHRDIKPSNVLLRDGLHVYLSDFGLVKHLETDSSITQPGALIGTPEYMAPELIDQPASKSSDLYALGIVLYQMLTGRVPFKSTTPMGIYWKHLQELPPPPSTINPAIEPAIEQVLLHALEKNPQQRFASAREFAQAYRNAISSQTTVNVRPSGFTPSAVVTALPTSRKATTPPMLQKIAAKKRPIALAVAALLCLFVLPAWLGFSFYSSHHHSQLSPIFTAFPLWNNYPIQPIVPGKQHTPPTQPPPTPTPTQAVPTPSNQAGTKSYIGQPVKTGIPNTYNQTLPKNDDDDNNNGNNNDNDKGNNNNNNGNGHGHGHHGGKHKH